ncbi:anaphase-promoting complex, cyclosome, subunit 3 domain-containing protein [Ditylenchus destructor]|uniref:Cell division cycle protein 27 homolog n=1 Tax=Ditylenchus destructor TaxID=166010 RepID=A0AAD4MLL4_9BILA|nr:anaphase-promoting complex, cyclosome, subunit 3 domain-containing protein [Ditylenchus destructor]
MKRTQQILDVVDEIIPNFPKSDKLKPHYRQSNKQFSTANRTNFGQPFASYEKCMDTRDQYNRFVRDAQANFNSERYQDAYNTATHAIFLDSKREDAYLIQARSKAKMNDTKKALNCVETGLRLIPNSCKLREERARSYFQIGTEQFESGNFQGALESYESSMNVCHQHNHLVKYALTYLRLERYQDAFDHATRAISMDPLHEEPYMIKARSAVKLRNTQEAIDCIENGIQNCANNDILKKEKALLLLLSGGQNSDMETLQRCFKPNATRPEFRYQYEQKINNAHTNLFSDRQNTSAEMNRTHHVLDFVDHVFPKFPTSGNAKTTLPLQNRNQFFIFDGKTVPQTYVPYEKCMDPNLQYVQQIKEAQAQFNSQRYEDAYIAATHANFLDSKREDGYVIQARSKAKMNETNKALNCVENGLRLLPNSCKLKEEKALIFFQIGNKYFERGDYQRALQFYQNCNEMPICRQYEHLVKYAVTNFRLIRLEEALMWARSAIVLDPSQLETCIIKIRSLRLLGKKEEAINCANLALRTWPDNDTLKDELNELTHKHKPTQSKGNTVAEGTITDDTCCAICLEIYSKPQTLLCGHSFCEECIDDLQVRNQNIECPICRETIRVNSKRVRNFALESLVESMKKHHIIQDENPQGSHSS